MKVHQIFRCKPFVTLVMVMLLLTPCGYCSFLSRTFDHVLATGQLGVYLTRNYYRSRIECTVYCLRHRVFKPPCVAFTCDVVNETCNFYTNTKSLLPASGVQMFMFRVTGTFQAIAIGDRSFSILVSAVEKNFTEARIHCNDMGGYLLQFDDATEITAVGQAVFGHSKGNFWVGANDLETEGTWVLDRDKTPVDNDVWKIPVIQISTAPAKKTISDVTVKKFESKSSSISTSSNNNCAMFYNLKMAVAIRDCSEEAPFLCERDV